MKINKLICLFLLFVPELCFGLDDACTKPDEFTIDKRCYVTDEQKQQKPYNSVVNLTSVIGRYCSGVLIKEKEKIYLYTAKHCVDKISSKSLKKNITAITLSGKKLKAVLADVVLDKDLIKYIVEPNDVDYVNISKKSENPFVQSVRVIGYGGFNVLSDKTIEKFKKKYIDFLQSEKTLNPKGTEYTYGFYNDEGVFYANEKVQEFLGWLEFNDKNFYQDIFGEQYMKISKCSYYTDTHFDGCQAVEGDSGGGMFNDNGDIIGIIVRALDVIGGVHNMELTEIENVQSQ